MIRRFEWKTNRLLRDTGYHRVSASESKHHFPEVFANDV